jgi:hypothetical protein
VFCSIPIGHGIRSPGNTPPCAIRLGNSKDACDKFLMMEPTEESQIRRSECEDKSSDECVVACLNHYTPAMNHGKVTAMSGHIVCWLFMPRCDLTIRYFESDSTNPDFTHQLAAQRDTRHLDELKLTDKR